MSDDEFDEIDEFDEFDEIEEEEAVRLFGAYPEKPDIAKLYPPLDDVTDIEDDRWMSPRIAYAIWYEANYLGDMAMPGIGDPASYFEYAFPKIVIKLADDEFWKRVRAKFLAIERMICMGHHALPDNEYDVLFNHCMYALTEAVKSSYQDNIYPFGPNGSPEFKALPENGSSDCFETLEDYIIPEDRQMAFEYPLVGASFEEAEAMLISLLTGEPLENEEKHQDRAF